MSPDSGSAREVDDAAILMIIRLLLVLWGVEISVSLVVLRDAQGFYGRFAQPRGYFARIYQRAGQAKRRDRAKIYVQLPFWGAGESLKAVSIVHAEL